MTEDDDRPRARRPAPPESELISGRYELLPGVMTRDQAKSYCGGIDPYRLAPPSRFSDGLRWIKEEVDLALDRLSGVTRTPAAPAATPACVVYFLQGDYSRMIKIGRTWKLERRLATLRAGSGEPLTLLLSRGAPPEIEQRIHGLLALHRSHGEWFRPHDDVLIAIEYWRAGGSFLRTRTP